jgi:osmotically-inducible protein OsmY
VAIARRAESVARPAFSPFAHLRSGTAVAEVARMTTSYETPIEEPFELSCLHAGDADIEDEVHEIVASTCGGVNVVVLVARGDVTLTGAVRERWMQLEVEHAVLHVRGVRSVVSRLRARPHH